MPRFFAELMNDGTALIVGRDAAHIAGPLRIHPGEILPIRVNEKGYSSVVKAVHPSRITLEVLEPEELVDRGQRRVHLAVGLLPPADMDEIIRFAAELGVASIIPVLTRRANIRQIQDARYNRWHDIILETLKITQRRSIPKIHPLTGMNDFVQLAASWPCRCVGLQNADKEIGEITTPETGILIGPEGGFTEEEIDLLTTHNFIAVHMGRTNMRTVSAAIAATAILART